MRGWPQLKITDIRWSLCRRQGGNAQAARLYMNPDQSMHANTENSAECVDKSCSHTFA